MKRRGFLKLAAGVTAIALSPVFLNVTRLQLSERIRGTFRFAEGEHNITEIGITDGLFDNFYDRIVLDEPITVLSDEYLDVVYTCYANAREPTITFKTGLISG